MRGPTATIIGAGIGGLTCAAALQRAGVETTTLEQAAELHPVGAGLTLQPNAVQALRRLGLDGPVLDVAEPLTTTAIHDWHGRRLSRLDEADAAAVAREVGAPAVGIHRATLHRILLAHAGRVRLDSRVTGLVGCEVRLADGSTLTSDIVIGADGLHSTVRAALFGAEQPRYSGYFCWRGVGTSDAFPTGWAGEYWGRGLRFGGCRIDGGRTYWFAVANGPAGTIPGDVRTTYADFPDPVRQVLADTPDGAIFTTPIHDRPPVGTWGIGPVTLLGDAAHPMTPNLGQGACQAIEDALVLGEQVARLGARADALRAYEDARRRRANATVRMAWRFGRMGQWSNAPGCWLRDTATRAIPPAAMRRQLVAAWRLPY